MPGLFGLYELDLLAALQVITLGFIGGVLSGFIGSGGAFFMTPGMMNLGVPGNISVGSNITHKFGKAMMGSKRHGELGNVDRKLGVFLIITAYIGIYIAVQIMSLMFGGSEGHESATGDLYISVVFISVLSVVSLSMLRDVLKQTTDDIGPSKKISEFLSNLRLFPMIYFPVADVSVSLWIVMGVGLATGYLAGTIGVGGFIGVPAMIYIFGVPTAVAAGTELYLAMFMGAFGAVNYVLKGFVDIRLTLLLYLGSLVGIYIGAYGTKVVKEIVIRFVTGIIILLCVLSRAIAIPVYLRQLGWLQIDAGWDPILNSLSKGLLFVSGITGTGLILFNVIKAYRSQRRVHASLTVEESRITASG
ncbi:MAG: sulfite exporter TauE/SafE family protein [bacterium]